MAVEHMIELVDQVVVVEAHLLVVVVEVPHCRWFLCHLEEIDFGCVVVVVVVQSFMLAL